MRSRHQLPQYLKSLDLVTRGAEIGVCQGSFSRHILLNWPGDLYCIDSWEEHQEKIQLDASNVTQREHNTNLSICREKLLPFRNRAKIITNYSIEASNLFKSEFLDFVYIDARHDYRSVDVDLRAWFPKVKSGGILCGHDYKNSFVRKNLVEVKVAVDNFSLEFGLTVNQTTEDNLPSWYIVKV